MSILKKLNENKIIITINILIIISYLIFATTVDLFGIDDIKANSYIFNPQFSFFDSINWILTRMIIWNARIGETLYFIIGCFPRWVYFILNGICLVTFLNLIFVYIYGKKFKTYIHSHKYIFSLLISYIILLTIYPAFSETIMWMAGAFNQLWDLTLVLLVGIPFRLLIDNKNIFENHKNMKFIYFILCFASGFSTENMVPWLLAYASIITIIRIIKKRNTSWEIPSIALILIGFIILYCFSSTTIRIDFFQNAAWTYQSKETMFPKLLLNYQYMISLTLNLLIIPIVLSFFRKTKKEFWRNFLISFSQLLLSFISIIVIVIFSPYFVIRVSILTFFFLMAFIIFLIDNIFFNDFIIDLLTIIMTILVIFITTNIYLFYTDFNYFNNIRYNYIKKQVENNETEIRCPLYDNRYNIFFDYRLSSFEFSYCDNPYIQYLFNDTELNINITYDKLR